MGTMTAVKTLGSISRCDVKGCRGEGLWKPVVVLPYDGKVAEAVIELHICTEHKKGLTDEYFKTIVHEEVSQRIRMVHAVPPTIGECSVRWEKWNPGIITLDA